MKWRKDLLCVYVCVCIFSVFFSPFFLSVCQILPKGVVSVIGPASSPASGSTVSHICGEKEVSVERKHTNRYKSVHSSFSLTVLLPTHTVVMMNVSRDLVFLAY